MSLPKLNSKAPVFTLPDQQGESISLKDFAGKWVVLYFYPKDNTPGCTIEAIGFTKQRKAFEHAGAVIVGISPDSPKSHCTFMEKQKLKVTLLSDETHKVLESYGVWGKKKFMGREYLGVLRTTFLIDPRGNIKHLWNDVKVNEHAQEVLEKLKEIQGKDKDERKRQK